MKLVSFATFCNLLATAKVTSAFTPSIPERAQVQVQSSPSSTILNAARKTYGNDNSSDNNVAAKKAALDGVLQKIERSYGRGSIVKLGDADNMHVESISTGALTLGMYEYASRLFLMR
jgi:hypothetical protein